MPIFFDNDSHSCSQSASANTFGVFDDAKLKPFLIVLKGKVNTALVVLL